MRQELSAVKRRSVREASSDAAWRCLARLLLWTQRGPSPREVQTMDSILGVHEAALLFRARRMEVLAANLANADTPHYQARDLTFSAVLDERMGAARQLKTTDARHLTVDPLAARETLQYRMPHQPSLDGNTVEADLELARYAENAVSYQASLMFASGRISSLRTALTGSRG
jgi:flagellar basal-body rod protein FlgB